MVSNQRNRRTSKQEFSTFLFVQPLAEHFYFINYTRTSISVQYSMVRILIESTVGKCYRFITEAEVNTFK